MTTTTPEVDELATALGMYATLASPEEEAKPDDAMQVDERVTSLTGGEKAPSKAEKPEKKDATPPAKIESAGYDRWKLLDDKQVDYGFLGRTGGAGIGKDAAKTFYITTAINYANGPGHMGHAYEGTTSDVIARFQRLTGDNDAVYFLTGSDEHGQKIANTAEGEGKQPQEICDKVRVVLI